MVGLARVSPSFLTKCHVCQTSTTVICKLPEGLLNPLIIDEETETALILSPGGHQCCVLLCYVTNWRQLHSPPCLGLLATQTFFLSSEQYKYLKKLFFTEYYALPFLNVKWETGTYLILHQKLFSCYKHSHTLLYSSNN